MKVNVRIMPAKLPLTKELLVVCVYALQARVRM